MAMKVHVMVFWVLKPSSLHPDDGGSMALWNVITWCHGVTIQKITTWKLSVVCKFICQQS